MQIADRKRLSQTSANRKSGSNGLRTKLDYLFMNLLMQNIVTEKSNSDNTLI